MRSRLTPVRNALGRALGDLAREDGRVLAPVWSEAVGPLLSQQSEPVQLSSGILVVRVTSEAFLAALEGERGRIIGRLADLVGRDRVTSISFVVS
jgi:hypothetical protein